MGEITYPTGLSMQKMDGWFADEAGIDHAVPTGILPQSFDCMGEDVA